jgi:primosomal protein N' (replication factor Y)
MRYAEVVVGTPVRRRVIPIYEGQGARGEEREGEYSPFTTTFHYSIPPRLAGKVRVGQLITVPWRNRRIQGIVVRLSDVSPIQETKDIEEIADPEPVLTTTQIELARWMSDYYLAPFIECLRTMLPPGLERRSTIMVELAPKAHIPSDLTKEQRSIIEFLRREGKQRASRLGRFLGIPNWRPIINNLARLGLIVKRYELERERARPKRARMVRLVADEKTIAEKITSLGHGSRQADVLLFLKLSEDPLPSLSKVCSEVGCSSSTIKALEKKGLVYIAKGGRKVAPLLPPQEIERVIKEELLHAPKQAAALALLREEPEPIEISLLCERVNCSRSVLKELERKGYVQLLTEEPAVILRIPEEEVVKNVIELRGAEKQKDVLDFLMSEGEPVWIGWIYAETGCNLDTLRDLEAHGLVRIEEEEVWRDPLAGRDFFPEAPPKLTPDQEAVWQEIKRGIASRTSHPVYLLHGVTGSGKTEIYMRALEEVLSMGLQAIVLVPEISLTPQTIRRFAVRFPGRIAVIHSKLSLGERYDTWRRIRAGLVDVVIGPRSAIFAPLKRIGLIVIDEEHETSYKQERTPRYHAREVAIKLAELVKAVVILGSATPDVVSYYKAKRGEYKLLRLKKRIMGHRRRIEEQGKRLGVPKSRYVIREVGPDYEDALYMDLPPVEVIDLRQELKAGNRGIFSRTLQREIGKALERGQQVILFLNRRGAATFIICRDCGYVLKCSRCDVPLTYHTHKETLLCHHCNRRRDVPLSCPNCLSRRIKFFGIGTQKVEEALLELFPNARTLRWDRDTTGGKWTHEIFLQRFISHEADVLIGTQMIAKGLDMPLVTLVGVVTADTSLHLPDFRSGERTFQLLAQVAGRAGRSFLGGKVIIQTYTPEHYSIQAASRHDYEGFYHEEISFRREQGLPPFTKLAKLVYLHSKQKRCQEEAERIHRLLSERVARLGLSGVDLIGPAPCFLGRIRGKYRWQIIVRARSPQALLSDFTLPLGWRIDIDPVSIL